MHALKNVCIFQKKILNIDASRKFITITYAL